MARKWFASGNVVEDHGPVWFVTAVSCAAPNDPEPVAAARALADHLNATGWTPPPERPPIDHIIAPSMLEEAEEHGYRVVDVRALAADIGRVRRARVNGFQTAQESNSLTAILDALGGK